MKDTKQTKVELPTWGNLLQSFAEVPKYDSERGTSVRSHQRLVVSYKTFGHYQCITKCLDEDKAMTLTRD